MVRDNVISFGQTAATARRRIADAKMKELVRKCREVSAETLPRLLQDLFENLDDSLYQLADKSNSDALRTRYFEAMRELRKLRQNIERSFLNHVLSTYVAFWDGEDGGGPDAFAECEDELQLVGDAELEEGLAVTNIITKAANRYHRELYALNQRFALIAGVGTLDDAENPLGPARLAQGFRMALDRWDGELEVKLVIYKLFDRHVMTYVGGLYDEVNDILIAAGILPKVAPRARRNPVAPSVQRARNPQRPEVQEMGAGEEAAQQELMGVLSRLLDERRSSLGHQVPEHLPVVPSREVLGALSELQHAIASAAPASVDEAQRSQGAIRVNLVQLLGMGDGEEANRRFAQPERDVIDVISMLFEFILDDRNLPDPMKALLSRLQIPMLKVAMLDRGFFASKNHPARRLLNNLARAAVAWQDDGDRSVHSLYGQIETIVTRVLTEFADEIELFAVLDAEFSAFLEREARGAEVAEQRITQVNRGQEQLKLARQQVRAALDERIRAAGPLPQPVRELLEEGWKDVLLLALLREGGDSAAWKSGLLIAERLLWSAQPKNDPQERQQMLKAIPELLRALRDGLANISFDQHRSATLFKALQACHIAALRGATVVEEPPAPEAVAEPEPQPEAEDAAPAATADEVAAEAAEEVAPGSEAEPAAAPDAYDEIARDLAVGQWIEWQEEDKTLRGKLSWKSEVTGSYVFVNRKGIKLAEMTAAGLAALFRDGRGRRLEDTNVPLMDRALDAMLDTLRRTGGHRGGPAPLPA
jgi:hypothetical protein